MHVWFISATARPYSLENQALPLAIFAVDVRQGIDLDHMLDVVAPSFQLSPTHLPSSGHSE